MKVKLHTGRMHQIRIHLASEGYPVLGDLIYGIPAINRKFNSLLHIQRQLLHCRNYRFVDHTEKTIDITAPIPEEFERVFGKIEKIIEKSE
jgi:23S rRNA pseudouridine955/2504/2580 synthase